MLVAIKNVKIICKNKTTNMNFSSLIYLDILNWNVYNIFTHSFS